MARIVVFEYQGKGLEKIIANQDELTQAIKESKKEVKGADFGSAKYNKANAQLQALNKTQKDVRKENLDLQKQMTVTADKGKRSGAALTAQLKLLETQFFNLGKAERRSNTGKALAKNIRDLRKEVRGINSEIGKRGLAGSLTAALASLGGGALLVGGFTEALRGAGRIVSDAVNVFADFNRQISFLGAVSEASAEDLELLKQNALDLGRTTQFTAEQVAQLGIEYAKLGFTPAEILAATADTLNFAAVAQAELGQAAKVTGVVLKSFQLDASNAGMVANFLSAAFSKSALDISKFETAFSQVGPVAATAGVSLERTVALMGILSDRGVDASTIGSGLRNVFLDLAKSGISLEDALAQINAASDKNVASLDLFGKRGATIGVILAETEGSVSSLTDELIRADEEGFAKIAGDKITADLKGTFDRMTSATEGLKIAFVDLIDGPLQAFLEWLVTVISSLSSFIILLGQLPKFIKDNQTEILGLTVAMIGLNSAAIAANATILVTNIRTVAMAAAQRGAAFATNILTVAQKGLNTALKANPIGLVITGVGLLITLFGTLRKRSKTVEASFQGLKALAKEFFVVIGEGFKAFGDSFTAFKEGRFKDGFKAFGKGISTFNPITLALREGKRLGGAFSKGYSESLEEAESAKVVQEQINEASERGAAIQADLSGSIDDTTKATGKMTKSMEEAAIATDNFAIGSVAQLRKEIRALNKELDEADEADARGILTKLIGAEKALDEVEQFQKTLRERLASEGSFGEIDPLSTLQVQATRNASDEIIEEIRERNSKIKAEQRDLSGFFEGLQDEIFNGIGRANDLLSEASADRAELDVSNLEDRYEREIELAEGNSERQEALRVELAQQTEEIEREEFERQKRFRVASALSSLAQGVINILSSPTTIPDPFGSIYKGVQIGFLTGTTLAQIGTINRQTAAEGIVIDAPQRMDSGGSVGGFARGAAHSDISGGINKIFNGQRVIIEHGEFSDRAEDGSIGVINKRSASVHKGLLSRIYGKQFAGKRALMSSINNYKNFGVSYAQNGLAIEPSIRSIASTSVRSAAVNGGSVVAVVDESSAKMIAAHTANAVQQVVDNANRENERRSTLSKRTGI